MNTLYLKIVLFSIFIGSNMYGFGQTQKTINGVPFIFYSYWASADRMGENIFPFGFNKRVFTVEKNGGLSFSGGRIYIETTARGSELLRKDTLTKKEKSELGVYQELLEYESLSRFVVGTERQRLEKEVRLKLNQEIENNTADWEQVYKHYNK